MSTESDKQNGNETAPAAGRLSRRTMLSGAGKAAVPAIITLYSGAALARSSNLISADGTPGPEGNKYNCLDTSSVYATSKPKVYDLGTDPMAHVTRVSSQKQYYRIGSNNKPSGNPINGQTMCAEGGNYLRKDSGSYKKVAVRKGVLVSATALSSFANHVTYTDV